MENQDKYGYIYLTENLINHKRYIGQHKSEIFDESYKGSGILVRRAFNKYGPDNFKTEVLEWCQSREELNEREKYWISYYDAVNNPDFYNIVSGGEGMSSEDVMGSKNPFYGKHHTLEVREKMHKPHKSSPKSSEHKKKIGEAQRGEKGNMYHKTHSDDVRKKMSDAKIGKKNSFYGKHHSEETRRKISQSKLNEPRGIHGSRKVIQYSVDMDEIARFKSISEASAVTEIDSRRISDACRGHFYSIGGFIWRYEEDANKSKDDIEIKYSSK